MQSLISIAECCREEESKKSGTEKEKMKVRIDTNSLVGVHSCLIYETWKHTKNNQMSRLGRLVFSSSKARKSKNIGKSSVVGTNEGNTVGLVGTKSKVSVKHSYHFYSTF